MLNTRSTKWSLLWPLIKLKTMHLLITKREGFPIRIQDQCLLRYQNRLILLLKSVKITNNSSKVTLRTRIVACIILRVKVWQDWEELNLQIHNQQWRKIKQDFLNQECLFKRWLLRPQVQSSSLNIKMVAEFSLEPLV